MIRNILAISAAACGVLAGCVPQGKYDEAVRTANDLRTELAAKNARLRDAQIGRASMQKDLDSATAVDEQLENELKKLGENAQSLLSENGALRGALQGSQKRLEELRRAQAAAEARAALYRDLATKLKGMIDAGDLAIGLRDGRMVLQMPNDILFDSGHAELKETGKRTLAALSAVLPTIAGRQFQVAGHTDNEPIRVSPFRSNWELSLARAMEVTRFLTDHGVDPHALSAAGYGEYDPVDTNQSGVGRGHNRRTEITLQPNIDEMVAVP